MHASKIAFCLFLATALAEKFDIKDKYDAISNRIGDKREFELWFVGTYLAAHKYFAADARYQVGDIHEEDRTFYKKFARLRELDPTLKKYCEQSVNMCVATIYSKAFYSGSMKYMSREPTSYLHSPFPSYYDMFRFRQTAAYYMCWFTQQRRPDLMYTSNTTCLEYLHTTFDVPADARIQHHEAGTKVIVDERDTTEYINKHPFACSEMWFCPDPCYGKKAGGNAPFALSRPRAERGNPCRDQANAWCEWKEGANNNFRDLIRNRFNYSCACGMFGFEWRHEYGICVDIDECFTGNYTCPSATICRNGMGTYVCTCQRGYVYAKSTGTCKRGELLDRRTTLLRYHPDIDQVEEETDFIDDLTDWLGLSGATTARMSIWVMFVGFASIAVQFLFM